MLEEGLHKLLVFIHHNTDVARKHQKLCKSYYSGYTICYGTIGILICCKKCVIYVNLTSKSLEISILSSFINMSLFRYLFSFAIKNANQIIAIFIAYSEVNILVACVNICIQTSEIRVDM